MVYSRSRVRPGFTLVEIFFVVLIISILIALLLPVLSKALIFGQDTAARSEIAQFDVSIAAAQRDLGYGGIDLPYLPSSIVLCDNWSDYGLTTGLPAGVTTTNLASSQAFLQKMFGKNIGAAGTGHLVVGSNNYMDWNGNGTKDGPTLLQGDQVLNFFLGGIPSNGNATGFASNPADPTMPAGTTGAGPRKGPYYDFIPNRLVLNSNTFTLPGVTNVNNGYFWYLDAYKHQPYIYLSSYGGTGYQVTDISPSNAGSSPYFSFGYGLTNFYINSDITASTIAINPRTYQLISAGRDGNFGAGGSWSPTTGYLVSSPPNAGADDLANFSKVSLGKPAN